MKTKTQCVDCPTASQLSVFSSRGATAVFRLIYIQTPSTYLATVPPQVKFHPTTFYKSCRFTRKPALMYAKQFVHIRPAEEYYLPRVYPDDTLKMNVRQFRRLLVVRNSHLIRFTTESFFPFCRLPVDNTDKKHLYTDYIT